MISILRVILALTGDPAKLSDQPEVKGVLERDSTLLLSIIYRLIMGLIIINFLRFNPNQPKNRIITPFWPVIPNFHYRLEKFWNCQFTEGKELP